MSLLKIARTDHKIDSTGLFEVRNYHLYTNDIYIEKELVDALYKFEDKHKPNIGLINVLFYTTQESAEIPDYRELNGKEYIKYTEDHTHALLLGSMVKNVLKDDLYDRIKSDQSYETKKVKDILEEMYLERIKDDPELIRQHQIYKNEQYANKA